MPSSSTKSEVETRFVWADWSFKADSQEKVLFRATGSSPWIPLDWQSCPDLL
jgi:hypothetical protein